MVLAVHGESIYCSKFQWYRAPAEGVMSIDQNTSDGESNSFHFSHDRSLVLMIVYRYHGYIRAHILLDDVLVQGCWFCSFQNIHIFQLSFYIGLEKINRKEESCDLSSDQLLQDRSSDGSFYACITLLVVSCMN